MELKYWIVLYVAHLLFWLWVVGWGGAELLEDTFVGQFLTRVGAPERSAAGIKFLACAAILVGTLIFGVGLLYPEGRSFHPWWLM